MKTKRFLAILLCVLMLGNLLPASAYAEEEQIICSVIWLNGDGTILDSKEYVVGTGEIPSTVKIPTKAADDNYTYVFAGWGEGEWNEKSIPYTCTFTPSFNSVPIKKLVAPKKVAKIEFSKASYMTTYKTSISIVVVIKDQNGQVMKDKEVVCKIENTTKKVSTTNSRGWVQFGIDAALIPATYTVKVECDGVSATAKLKVVKVTHKLIANEKTFKSRTKVKKYTAILEDSKGKRIKGLKLILKVNKKKYIAKTDKRGKATFKIKKLTKKGKYTASIKFQGDKYYNKVTKKVKIIVK